MVAPLLAADAISAQVKIVKRESEFAAARGVTLVVGERIPGLKRWRLAKVERRLHGDDVPEPAMVRLTIARS